MKLRFLVTCVALFVLAAVPAFASVFGKKVEITHLAVGADSVVIGEVISVHGVEMENGRIHTMVTLSVDEAFKGSLRGGELARVMVPGGIYGGRVEMVSGAPVFGLHEKVLLFMTATESGFFQLYGMSQGKFNIHENDEIGIELVVSESVEHHAHQIDLGEIGIPLSDLIDEIEVAVEQY